MTDVQDIYGRVASINWSIKAAQSLARVRPVTLLSSGLRDVVLVSACSFAQLLTEQLLNYIEETENSLEDKK